MDMFYICANIDLNHSHPPDTVSYMLDILCVLYSCMFMEKLAPLYSLNSKSPLTAQSKWDWYNLPLYLEKAVLTRGPGWSVISLQLKQGEKGPWPLEFGLGLYTEENVLNIQGSMPSLSFKSWKLMVLLLERLPASRYLILTRRMQHPTHRLNS